MLEYPESIDENFDNLTKMKEEIDSINGIEREDMLEAFFVLAEETIALLIQVFADTKEHNTELLEGIETLKKSMEVQEKLASSATVGGTMLVEDEVNRVLEEE